PLLGAVGPLWGTRNRGSNSLRDPLLILNHLAAMDRIYPMSDNEQYVVFVDNTALMGCSGAYWGVEICISWAASALIIEKCGKKDTILCLNATICSRKHKNTSK